MSPLYKKILMVMTSLVVIITCVTYNPSKSHAIAGAAARIVATQTIKAATKSAVTETVENLLVKELLEEVTESYAKKQGYKLIENAGQRMYIKETFDSAEKTLLKKQIDKVIDAEVYGNTPKFIKYLDWFVGVGAVLLVGQVLYATLTGDFGSYMMDIITQALSELGWLEPAAPIGSPTPQNPLPAHEVVDSTNYTRDTIVPSGKVLDFSVSGATSQSTAVVGFRFDSKPYNGLVTYLEMIPTSANGFSSIMPVVQNDHSIANLLYSGYSTYDGYSTSMIAFAGLSYKVGLNQTRGYQIFIGGKQVASLNGTGSSIEVDLRSYLSTFNSSAYNRRIYQHRVYDPATQMYVSTLILQDTYLKKKPDVYIRSYDTSGYNYSSSDKLISRLDFSIYSQSPTSTYPYKVRYGIFNDLDLALTTDMLPMPKLNPTDLKIPILNSENKVLIPQKTILPDGHTYDPVEQVIKDPTGNVITDPTLLDLPVPDPVIKPGTDGNIQIDDNPTDIPNPPDGDPPTDDPEPPPPDESKPEDIQWKKLKAIPAIFTTKFPFSLPWDIERFMTSLFGDVPTVSELKWEVPPLMGIDPDIVITIPDYFDQWFSFGRTTVLVMFDISLVYAIYRLLGGAS